MNLENIALITMLSLFVLEVLRGTYAHSKVSLNDWVINVISLAQENLIRPLFALALATAAAWLLPSHQNALAHLPFWPTLIAFLFIQDFIHYWYHRIAHEWEPLWNIHRVHHSAKAMSVMVNSRINVFWQLLMPVNYVSAVAIYMGLLDVFLVWWAFRAVLNFLTHTEIRWDLPLYKIKALKPLIWVVEHLITTPDAHHAHHGFGENAQPMGNYAPVLLFWDHVFGTAKLPHSQQTDIGIEGDPDYLWYQQLWWPIFSLKKKPAPTTQEPRTNH
jgi:sterol desaturase/sphingolipid hydroxylase (fatty acid hydroxylase superfamily)